MSSALTARGSTARWRRIREWVLQRDGHTCLATVDGHLCGAPANTVGHIIRREHGGGDGGDNLQAQCTNCNYGESRAPARLAVTRLTTTQAALVRLLDTAGVPSTAGRRVAAAAMRQRTTAHVAAADLDAACRWRRARGPLTRV